MSLSSQRGALALSAILSGSLDTGRSRFEASARLVANGKGSDALSDALRDLVAEISRGGDGAIRSVSALLRAAGAAAEGRHRRFLLRVFRFVAAEIPEKLVAAVAYALEGLDSDAKLETILIMRGIFGRSAVEIRRTSHVKLVQACSSNLKFSRAAFEILQVDVERDENSRFARQSPLTAAAADVFMLCVLENCAEVAARRTSEKLNATERIWDLRSNICEHLLLVQEDAQYQDNQSTRNTTNPSIFVKGMQDLRDDVEKICQKTPGVEGSASLEVYVAAIAAHLLAAGSALVKGDPAWQDPEDAVEEITTCLAELNATTQRTQKLALMENQLEADDQRFELDQVAKIQVRRLCLLLGRCAETSILNIVVDARGQALLQLAVQQLGRHSGTCAKLSSELVGIVLLTICGQPGEDQISHANSLSIEDRVGKGYAPLLDLLKAEGAVADCASEILASGAKKYPDQLLPDIIGIVASAPAPVHEREKALLTLEKYVALNQGSMSPFEEVMRARLLELALHENLTLKRASGSVLGQVSPDSIVPYLCDEIASTTNDATSRSAASAALQLVFQHHTDTRKVFTLWFERVNNDDESPQMGHLRDSCKRWARVVPPHLWQVIFRDIIAASQSKPESSGPIAVARRLVEPYIREHAQCVIEADLVEMMRTQPCLSEELLSEKGNEEQVRQLLFQRMSPLLFLTMLPLKSMLDSGINACRSLVVPLLERCIGVYEFKEVRQLAAQALGSLDFETVVLPIAQYGLENFAAQYMENQDNNIAEIDSISESCWKDAIQNLKENVVNEAIDPPDVTVAKALVFAVQNSMFQNPRVSISREFIDLLVKLLQLPCSSPNSQLANLQEGSIHVLSQMASGQKQDWLDTLQVQARKPQIEIIGSNDDVANGSHALDSDDQEDSDDEGFSSGSHSEVFAKECLRPGTHVYKYLVRTICRDSSIQASAGLRICLANVILTTMRRMAQNAAAEEEDNGVLIAMTANSILIEPLIQSVLFSRNEARQDLPAIIQVLFTACLLRSKALAAPSSQGVELNNPVLSATSAQQLCRIALQGLDDSQDDIRISCVKLVGALLTLPSSTALPDGATASFIQKLSGLANLDSCKEVRALASQLANQL